MTKSASRLLRRLAAPSLLVAGFFAGTQAKAQNLPASGFMPHGSALGAAPGDTLPRMPPATPAIVRAAVPPGEQGLVLPRDFRIAPAATESNLPRKFRYYLGSTVALRNFAEATLIAGIPNITSAPVQPHAPTTDDPVASSQYQVAMDAYSDQIDTWRRVNEATLRYHGYRFGVGLATAETRDLLSNLVLPLALHQQAPYIPAPVDSSFGERMSHALASIVVTRNDAGVLVPNYSKLGGTVAAAFIGKSLYADAFNAPELNSDHFVVRYIGYSLLGDLATNVSHELIRAAVKPDLTYYNLHGRSSEDSYYPLSIGGKLIYWVRSTYAVRNFASGALIASRPVIPSEPVEPVAGNPATFYGYPNYDEAYNHYGDTLLAWKDGIENDVRYRARRFAGGFGESETQMLLQNLVIPVAFDMDPRYVPLGQGHSTGQRFGHAVEGLWITHTDAGNRTVNLPLLGGTFGAAALAKAAYYPQLGTPSLTSTGVFAKTVGANLAVDVLYNIIGEFLRHRGY